MRHFQGIVFMWIRTFSEIFESGLVYLYGEQWVKSEVSKVFDRFIYIKYAHTIYSSFVLSKFKSSREKCIECCGCSEVRWVNQIIYCLRSSCLELFVKFSQNSQEKTCARVSFWIKTLALVFSCNICKIFKNTFFYSTPPVAASDVHISIKLIYLNFRSSFEKLVESLLTGRYSWPLISPSPTREVTSAIYTSHYWNCLLKSLLE